MTAARTELGERLGIGTPHADIDLCRAESQVEQHGRAIIRAQRLVVRSALGHHRAAVHRGLGRRQTQGEHVAPMVAAGG
jgi:hypothetical protein